MLQPWANAGYRCYAVDIENNDTTETVGNGTISYIKADVGEWERPDEPARIGFAFPPCTDLAVSGARWFQEKGLSALADAIQTVADCRQILTDLDCPWMIENPVSTLSTHWREPDYKFDPYQYDGYTSLDERYTKETWLWTGGGFKMPKTDGVGREDADDRIHKMAPSTDRNQRRAKTPTGFAQAVYLAHEEDRYARTGTGVEQQPLIKPDVGRKNE
jgi:hypothetical protein